MNKKEIEQTIFKFMGNDCPYKYDETGEMIPINYTDSLDALIPVVESIDFHLMHLTYAKIYGKWIMKYSGKEGMEFTEAYDSPSMALATACAKVIKELK